MISEDGYVGAKVITGKGGVGKKESAGRCITRVLHYVLKFDVAPHRAFYYHQTSHIFNKGPGIQISREVKLRVEMQNHIFSLLICYTRVLRAR